jgi:hypothetical protein
MARPSTKSEMARSSECTEQYALRVLDTADIVRDAMLRQPSGLTCAQLNSSFVQIAAQSHSHRFIETEPPQLKRE